MPTHRRLCTLCLAVLGFAVTLGVGGTTRARAAPPGGRPVAVSPGDASRLVEIGDPCPTFSWGAVAGAKLYELVVYAVKADSEEAEPVLRQRVSGSASSWTPSLESCLSRGGRYAWSIGLAGKTEVSNWSPLSFFQVASQPTVAEFEEAVAVVRQYLQEHAGGPGRALGVESTDLHSGSNPGTIAPSGAAATTTDDPPSASLPSARAVPQPPATISLATEGALGVGTSTPQADLHVVGSATVGGMLLAPDEPSADGASELLFAEDDDGSFGMKLRYDGVSNTLSILGQDNGPGGTWLTIERDGGGTTFSGQATFLEPTTFSEQAIFLQPTTFSEPTTFLEEATFSEQATFLQPITFVEQATFSEPANFLQPTTFSEQVTFLEPTTFLKQATFSEPTTFLGQVLGIVPDPPCFNTSQRFMDCGNGTVSDAVTGLIYLKDASCFGQQNWPTASASAAGLAHGQCGLTDGSRPGDWRLQTKEEWEAIVRPDCTSDPKIVGNGGDSSTSCYSDSGWASGVVSSTYWSATANSADTALAWDANVNFGVVSVSYRSFSSYAWPVRGH